MAEAAWVRIQKKTFTRWSNNYLSQRGMEIGDLAVDLKDGVFLHTLLEILGGEEVRPSPNRRAKMKLQMVENLNTCLKYIKSKGISLVNIGAEDIHDGKLKLILGLIWTLILRFQIVGEDEDSANARAALLEWCNMVLNPQGLYVKNFTSDWQDGRCFCGLVNAIEPGHIPLNEVPATQAMANMGRAFDSAEELFGFPQVLDAEDVVENPDDLSIMTYVSYFRAYMLANNAFGPNCYAEGPGLVEATTFEQGKFTIITMNEENERVERGGAMVSCKLLDNSGADVCPVQVTDNRDGTYAAVYVAQRPGVFTLDIKVKKRDIKNSPYHPNVKPGEPMPGNCTADGPGISKATAGEETFFRVITKDVGGNLLPRGGATIKAVMKDPKGDVPVAVHDNNDGTYRCTYTATTAGTTKLSVQVETKFNGTGHIQGSEFSVNVSPASASGAHSVASGPGLSKAVAGQDNPYSVQTRDRFDNNIKTGGAAVAGQLVHKETGEVVPVQVKDNGDGTYSNTYPGVKKAGTYTLTPTVAGEGVKDSPFTVTVSPAAASAGSFTWDGLELDADGNKVVVAGTTESFSVTARDQFGNQQLAGGLKVTGTIDGPSKVDVKVTDNNNGVYGLQYTPTKSGKNNFTVLLDATPIGGHKNPFSLIVIPAEAYGPTSPASGKGTSTAVAGEDNPFTIHTHDRFDNEVVTGGASVAAKLTNNATGAAITAVVADKDDGTYLVTYPGVTVAGTYTLAPTVASELIKGAPFTVTVSVAAADGSQFEWVGLKIDGEGRNVVVAGATEAFTVIAKDRFGNRLPTGGLEIVAKIGSGPADVAAKVADNGDGSYGISYTPTKAGDYQVTVSYQGKPIGGHKNPFPLRCVPDVPSAANSVASGSGLSKAVAGEPNPYSVQARDRFDNDIKQGGAEVKGELTHAETGEKVTVDVVDNGDGTYSASYASIKTAGKYSLVPTVGGSPVKGAPFTVNCSEAAVDGSQFEWVGLKLDGDGNNVVVAGTTETFTVIAKDRFGNRLTTGGLKITGAVSDSRFGVEIKVADGKDGSYVLSYTPTKADKYKFTVALDGTPIGGFTNPFPLLVIPADAYGPTSIASGEGLSTAIAGEDNTFFVGSHDRFENECHKGGAAVAATLKSAAGEVHNAVVADEGDGTYNVSYPGVTKAGTYKINPTIAGESVKGAPFTVTIHAADADAAHFTWDGLDLDADGNKVVVAGTTEAFTVVAHDRFGNRAEAGGLKVTGTISDGPAAVSVNVSDKGDGSYKLDYTPTIAGKYKFLVALDGTAIGGKTNPFGLVVIPAEAHGPHCIASGAALKNGSVGSDNAFNVETRDRFDNKLTKGGSKVDGKLVLDGKGDVVPLAVKDNGDGTYVVSYPTVAQSGSYTLTPNVNGEGVKDSPFKVTVGAGGFDLNNTGVDIPKPGFTGRRGPRVAVKDKQGNLRAGFDDHVEADLTPKSKIPKVKAKSNGDGTYDIDYPPNLMPGDYDVDISVNGQAVPQGTLGAQVKQNELTPEHAAAVDAVAGNGAGLIKRLMLSATDAERDALIATLQGLKK